MLQEVLVDKLRRKEIIVPPFQRKFVWKLTQASKLVESFLLGLPVPPIYLYSRQKESKMLLVDGQQRLRSIDYFFSGMFGEQTDSKQQPFRLTGLHPRSRFANKTYEELEESDSDSFVKLNDAVFRSFVVKQLNPDDDTSVFHIFERLNTGGTFLQGPVIGRVGPGVAPGPPTDPYLPN